MIHSGGRIATSSAIGVDLAAGAAGDSATLGAGGRSSVSVSMRQKVRGPTRTPGFSTPAGSTARFAARRASANGSGRWRSYQGRWSRPTAWWWVIVPPASITVSETAALISSHCSTSPPRLAGQSTV